MTHVCWRHPGLAFLANLLMQSLVNSSPSDVDIGWIAEDEEEEVYNYEPDVNQESQPPFVKTTIPTSTHRK